MSAARQHAAQYPAGDRLFALIASIPGSGAVKWCDEARTLLDEIRAEEQPTVSPSAPADRGVLRDEIAEALMRWAERNNDPKYARVRRPDTVTQNAYDRADAVLAVLPASADRSAVLREAADAAEDVAESLRKRHEFERSTGALDVMTALRRLAAEAPQPETQAESGSMAIMLVPCSLPRCDTTPGESCSTHKRLWAHADGDHELCGAECSAAQPETDADSRSAR